MVKATVAHTLAWSPTEENAIDQVAAIGFATKKDKMGSPILRMEALDANSARQVILLTARRLTKRFRIENNYARKIAFAVLHEYLCPNCFYCGGKGEIYEANTTVKECPHCNGTGMHRFTDQQRGHLLGGRTYNQRIYEDALNYVKDTARAVVGRAQRRLDDDAIAPLSGGRLSTRSMQQLSVGTVPKRQDASDDDRPFPRQFPTG